MSKNLILYEFQGSPVASCLHICPSWGTKSKDDLEPKISEIQDLHDRLRPKGYCGDQSYNDLSPRSNSPEKPPALGKITILLDFENSKTFSQQSSQQDATAIFQHLSHGLPPAENVANLGGEVWKTLFFGGETNSNVEEIPRPTTIWMVLKPSKIMGIFDIYLVYQLVVDGSGHHPYLPSLLKGTQVLFTSQCPRIISKNT